MLSVSIYGKGGGTGGGTQLLLLQRFRLLPVEEEEEEEEEVGGPLLSISPIESTDFQMKLLRLKCER